MRGARSAEVVVLGAGFAGLTAARRLAGHRRVLVVDRNAYQTLRPKLPEAVGGTCACAARLPVADALARSGAQFLAATVEAIDPEAQVVRTDSGPIRYDRLIVALGSRPRVPAAVPGAADLALPLWDFDHACAIRRRVTMLARAASRAATARERRALASVVVVGGGSVGVEVAGHLQARLAELTRTFGLEPGDAQVRIVEQAPRLLPGFGAALGAAVDRDLGRRGVLIHLGMTVRAVVDGGVVLADGARLAAGTVVWAGGVRPAEPVAALGAATAGGRIQVRADLRSLAWPRIYAAGDAAALTAPGGGLLPPSAQVAMQAGAAVADSVARDLAGLPSREYRVRERGVVLGLGTRDARASVGSFGFGGTPARLLKEAVLAHYLLSVGGRRVLAAYLAPVILRPLRGRVEVGNPQPDVQRADPAPRVAAR